MTRGGPQGTFRASCAAFVEAGREWYFPSVILTDSWHFPGLGEIPFNNLRRRRRAAWRARRTLEFFIRFARSISEALSRLPGCWHPSPDWFPSFTSDRCGRACSYRVLEKNRLPGTLPLQLPRVHEERE
jgi:hypothetical protein